MCIEILILVLNLEICRWQGDYNGQVKKWFPVNFTEETVIAPKQSVPEVIKVS